MEGPSVETKPYRIELSPLERERLERRVRRQTATKREVFRAQVVLLAAIGLRKDEVADHLGTAGETVSRWGKRYFLEGDACLVDRPRSGRPRAFPLGWSSRSRPSCAPTG